MYEDQNICKLGKIILFQLLTQISEYWGNVTKCGGNLKFSTLREASCLCGCQSVYQMVGLFRSCAQLG
jgi:hypothetical protein